MGKSAAAVHVVGFAEDLAAEKEGEACRGRIVDVAGFDGDEAVKEFCGSCQARVAESSIAP
jgi:hypothetical protein